MRGFKSSAHLVAHLDTTQDPPALVGFAIYSEPAMGITHNLKAQLLLDVMETEAEGAHSYGIAKANLLEYLRSDRCHLRYKGEGVLRMLQELLDLCEPRESDESQEMEAHE